MPRSRTLTLFGFFNYLLGGLLGFLTLAITLIDWSHGPARDRFLGVLALAGPAVLPWASGHGLCLRRPWARWMTSSAAIVWILELGTLSWLFLDHREPARNSPHSNSPRRVLDDRRPRRDEPREPLGVRAVKRFRQARHAPR